MSPQPQCWGPQDKSRSQGGGHIYQEMNARMIVETFLTSLPCAVCSGAFIGCSLLRKHLPWMHAPRRGAHWCGERHAGHSLCRLRAGHSLCCLLFHSASGSSSWTCSAHWPQAFYLLYVIPPNACTALQSAVRPPMGFGPSHPRGEGRDGRLHCQRGAGIALGRGRG